MTGSVLKQETSSELIELFALLASSGSDTLGSLVGRDIAVAPVETTLLDADTLVASLTRPYVVARAELGQDYAERAMWILLDVQDAIAMSGMLMMTPDDVIQQRRSDGVLEGEDAEAFGELGNVMFSGIATVLRDKIDNIELAYRSHGQIKQGADTDGILESGVLVAHAFQVQFGDFPETLAYMVTDLQTAEAWNKQPLESSDGVPRETESEPAAPKSEDDGFEGIPAAPILGVLAAFVSLPDVYRTLRQSCRRIGLDLQRHGKGDIPNPAAHRDQIVLLDIPAGEVRQFDWCKRIKDFAAETKVVLLIHHPSRNRVTQAFLSKADAILGLPCDEPQLSQKLTAVLEAKPVVPEEE